MSANAEMFALPDDQDPNDLINRDLGEVAEDKWAPLLVALLRVFEARGKRRGLSDDAAYLDAADIVKTLAVHFGGRNVYLPKGERMMIALRDAQLWRRYDRKPTAEMVRQLAGEIGVSDIHMYAILAKQRELYLRKIQGRLFED